MSLFEDTNPRDLKELLSLIQCRELALPDFQRDFVWDPSATQELIVSIANNFPAGSLLRIRNTQNLFAAREFEGAPPLNGHKPIYLILDGQQRLTSLYQAFYGVGEHRFYVNLQGLLAGKEFEDCIFHLARNRRQAQRLEALSVQASDLIFPLSVLLGQKGGFLDWTLQISKLAPTPSKADDLRDQVLELRKGWVETIDDYRFPVVTLSDETKAEAVCTIFETLNRTGVKLSVFELLTAKFWPANLRLRDLWATACSEHPIIASFEIDPYYILQILALLKTDSAPSCKRSDVLKLNADHVAAAWNDAVWGLAESLKILRDDCGVWLPQWMPYSTVVIPMAAMMAKTRSSKGIDVAANRQKIARWFWCSVFGQTYENAPNTQAAQDVNELRRWFEGGEPPAPIRTFRFDPQILRDVTPRQRALYRGAVALIMRNSPRDFHKGEKLGGDLILSGNADDHHIFPAAYLAIQNVPEKLRDIVLNRTLIDRETNNRIWKNPPSKYLSEIKSQLGVNFEKVLQSHLLPIDEMGLASLLTDSYDGFLNARLDLLQKALMEVTGASWQNQMIVALEGPIDNRVARVEELDGPEIADPLHNIPQPDEKSRPWIADGKAWHLDHQCAPNTSKVLLKLMEILHAHAGMTTISWSQKYYVAMGLAEGQWLKIGTQRNLLRLDLWSPGPLSDLDLLAERLKVRACDSQMSWAERLELPNSVEVKAIGKYFRTRVRIRQDFDLENPEFARVLQEWRRSLDESE